MDMASQIFEILRKPGYTYLTQVSYFLLNFFSANMGIDFSFVILNSFILMGKKLYSMYRMTSSLS
jgi:hypothetical protein